MREAVQQAVHQAAKPARASLFPPGVKHVLFYKAPPQRVQTHNIDALMEEAKRYLEMGKVRPRSSRSDHVLAASIFAGCTIALTWLLVTCSMKEAEKAKPTAPTIQAAASPRGDRAKPVVKPVVADTQTETVATGKALPPTIAAVASGTPATVVTTGSPVVALAVPVTPVSPKELVQVETQPSVVVKEAAQALPSSSAEPKQPAAQVIASSSVEPKPAAQAAPLSFAVPKLVAPKQSARVASGDENTATPPAKPATRVKVATLSEAHVNERVALSRSTHPATRPTPSTQPEWAVKQQHDAAATTDDAPWLNWSAQQQRPTMRAAVPVPGDNNWNDHMTQRRITDDPPLSTSSVAANKNDRPRGRVDERDKRMSERRPALWVRPSRLPDGVICHGTKSTIHLCPMKIEFRLR
jgi:hypothetical protein